MTSGAKLPGWPVVAKRASAHDLADMVVSALIAEATLTPKPGLVDLRSRGSHSDLDCALMCRSAAVLHGSFLAMAQAGASIEEHQRLRERIGAIGREAEALMLQETGGINTHRGAIWALGLLACAAAQDGALVPVAIAARAGALARCPDRFAPQQTGNKGELACREYGVGGARAQAQADFPHVIHLALPMLARSRAAGDGESAAAINALLAIVAELDDTCILSRGGPGALADVQHGARQVLIAGGIGRKQGRAMLQQYEAELLRRNLSPGGAADLLAAAMFLDRVAAD
jgi:triphosphoribosyl-dephospho-CoA synthase